MAKKNNNQEYKSGGKYVVSPVSLQIEGRDDLLPADFSTTGVPVAPLRDIVLFPYVSAPLPLGRESTLKLMNDAQGKGTIILCVAQKDPNVEDPGKDDLYETGVLARVVKVLDLPDGSHTALLQTYAPARLLKLSRKRPYLKGEVEMIHEVVPDRDDKQVEVCIEAIRELFVKVLGFYNEQETSDLRFMLSQTDNLIKEINLIIINSMIPTAEKQMLLEESDVKQRFFSLLPKLDMLVQHLELKAEINQRTRVEMSQQQKEHFLQQQIRSIQDELGGSVEDSDIEELRERAEQMKWNEAAMAHFDKELKKLTRFNAANPEYSIQYNYLDTLLSLPWDNYTPDSFSLDKVEKILDRDHYGLEKVKERIIEQMAVIKLRKDMKAPIICLYGPPGVGKTSLGRSIADALGREYARVALGGLHDEAEIRGHRKTYIGAMPGRIISAMAKCGSGNPVFVLDEIDKIGKDFKGDPATALLEVLDPEQNNKFHDNYLDFDYDLSKVLFIATANNLSTIERPLLDRMEIIEISGYITEEKVEIARRHLVPDALTEHGFEPKEIVFNRDALRLMTESYTRESGVRQLNKKISKVLRKIARLKASGKTYPTTVTPALVKKLLGPEEITPETYENNDFAGVVTGLAWTQSGGDILFIESSLSPGKGEKLTLTGNLGDVMKESAVIALQYLKAHADKIGIDSSLFAKMDVHIHVPEGAIPKDGPSAGITMVTSLASAFSGRKVREKIAMTGEITLRGKVLPVGGIKEKILAAKRAGIKEIIMCSQNRKDVGEIDERYIKGLTFHYVDRISEVLSYALLDEKADDIY